jgi:hypothetical protein
MAVDGLAELRAQRSRRTAGRGLPAPQHPKAEPVPQPEPAVEERPSAAGVQPPAPVRETRDGTESRASRAANQVGSAATTEPEPSPVPAHRRSRVRATQVHLDQASEDHLRELRKRAVLADVDLTQSAVLRLALAELVEHHGYDRIVRMFAEDEPTIRRGRPRR